MSDEFPGLRELSEAEAAAVASLTRGVESDQREVPNLFPSLLRALRSSPAEPAAPRPTETAPASTQPSASRSAAVEPSASEPAAVASASTQPSASRSAAVEPSTSEPAASAPATTQLSASRSAAIEPSACEPAATAPAATLSSMVQASSLAALPRDRQKERGTACDALGQSADGYAKAPPQAGLAVEMEVAGLYFSASLSKRASVPAAQCGTTPSAPKFLVAICHAGEGEKIDLAELVGKLVPDLEDLPDISIPLQGSFLVVATGGGSKTRLLLGQGLDAEISLSGLPLVGKELPSSLNASVSNFHVLAALAAFEQADIEAINGVLKEQGIQTQLPACDSQSAQLPRGIHLSGNLQLGDAPPQDLHLGLGGTRRPPAKGGRTAVVKPVHGSPSPIQAGHSPAPTPATSVSAEPVSPAPPHPETVQPAVKVKYFNLNKKLSPVLFKRVGASYQNKSLAILLDVELETSGLRLSAAGLGLGMPVKDLARRDLSNLEFHLDGIDLEYRSSSVEIGGAFLHRKLKLADQTLVDDYSGEALIKTKALTLSTIGSYAELHGEASLFLYAFLDRPMGGPPFFFVTGLAVGFGYNRNLLAPQRIEEIETFPLVSLAMARAGTRQTPPASANQAAGGKAPSIAAQKQDLLEVLGQLSESITPAKGRHFLAVGVKFTSFKLIDSFGLLLISLGEEFRLTLLGLSKIVAPPAKTGTTPIAEVMIGLRADFSAREGTLRIEGKILPGSYALDHACRLSGGFAFYSWFKGEHAGDFILSVGGYHSKFQKPAHYPAIDRVSLNWQIDSHLSVKGNCYFALCSHAIMAGGHLEARLDKGNLQAWFHLTTDFLVSWKPLYYDISYDIGLGISYRTFMKTFKVEIGAGIHIWGPKFTGNAHIKVLFVSFDVRFGAKGTQLPPALTWDDFREAFLPHEPTALTSLILREGLLRSVPSNEGGETWLVEPKNLALVVDVIIPLKDAADLSLPECEKQLGIASMDVRPDDLCSSLQVTIEKRGPDGYEDCKADFRFEPIRKQVPAALWGRERTPGLNGRPIGNVLGGVAILPAGHPAPGDTNDIWRSDLRFNIDSVEDAIAMPHRKLTPPLADVTKEGPGSKATYQRADLVSLVEPAARASDPMDPHLNPKLILELREMCQVIID